MKTHPMGMNPIKLILFIVTLFFASMANSQSLTKIKMSYFPALVDTPSFVAKAEGFFEKNGLDVELIAFTNGPALLSSLLSGSTQFIDGGGALITFPQVAKGHNIRGIANFWSENFYMLIAKSDIPVPNKGKPYPTPLLDLKGKRIGVTALGAQTAAMVENMIRDAGLTPGEDITIVPAGAVNTAISALATNNIDAYLAYQPINQLLDLNYPGSYQIIFNAQDFPESLRINLFNHLASTEEYITKNPEIAQAMCKSIQQALQWIQQPENFDRTVEILEAALPGNPPGVMAAALKEAMPAMMGNGETLGQITPTAVENANKLLLGLNYISEEVSPDTYIHSACNS
ncbi:ABC transporter substrate-binding protein [Yanghanlia caeni]|uniref:ABC transporter substrate-binding protein n=1 Tax=Yanghanlia caeni TaxID=3064283 RepID=A0ABU1D9U6_9BURK|nr:ABC transporter substrate-binding protein [Alcaligenaceae bacterium LG-2]